MIINGKPTLATTTDEIVQELATLPSSFPDYINNNKPKPPLSPEDQAALNQAQNLYSIGIELMDKDNPQDAIVQLEAALNALPEVRKGSLLSSNLRTTLSNAYQTIGEYKPAEQLLQTNIEIALNARQYNNAEFSYKQLALLLKEQGTIEQYRIEQGQALQDSLVSNDQVAELKARLALGGVYRALNNRPEAIKHYAAAYSLQQGRVAYDAHRVEQHEVGFSNEEKIGTDNIQECIATIIHDPITKKTALAHVDKYTDPSSLSEDVISKFPPDTPLDAYLVGGRLRTEKTRSTSDANIKKVTEELNKHPFINIRSADIGDKGAPSGIIFDPKTAKLEHAVPGKIDETTAIRQVYVDFNDSNKLYVAFDLTESKNINVPTFTEEQQEEIMGACYFPGDMSSESETWQADILNPLTKTAGKIKENDPNLVQYVIEFIIGSQVDQLNIPKDKKEEAKKVVLYTTRKSLEGDFIDSIHKVAKIEDILNKAKKAEQSSDNAPIIKPMSKLLTDTLVSYVDKSNILEVEKDSIKYILSDTIQRSVADGTLGNAKTLAGLDQVIDTAKQKQLSTLPSAEVSQSNIRPDATPSVKRAQQRNDKGRT